MTFTTAVPTTVFRPKDMTVLMHIVMGLSWQTRRVIRQNLSLGLVALLVPATANALRLLAYRERGA